MAKGTPSTPPGENSSGRTYDEQKRYEQRQKIAELDKKNPIADAIKRVAARATKPVDLSKNKGVKSPVLRGSPNMAKVSAVQKAKKNVKKTYIPVSPTH